MAVNGGFDIAMAADDDHRQLRMQLLGAGEHIQSVELGALQPDIEDDQRWPSFLDCTQRLVAILGQPCLMAFVFKNAGDELSNIRFVVDNQNVRRHG